MSNTYLPSFARALNATSALFAGMFGLRFAQIAITRWVAEHYRIAADFEGFSVRYLTPDGSLRWEPEVVLLVIGSGFLFLLVASLAFLWLHNIQTHKKGPMKLVMLWGKLSAIWLLAFPFLANPILRNDSDYLLSWLNVGAVGQWVAALAAGIILFFTGLRANIDFLQSSTSLSAMQDPRQQNRLRWLSVSLPLLLFLPLAWAFGFPGPALGDKVLLLGALFFWAPTLRLLDSDFLTIIKSAPERPLWWLAALALALVVLGALL